MKRLRLILIGALLLLAGRLCYAGQSPNAAPEETDPKLKARVHLVQGATTVARVTASLSRQSGLVIETPDYLRERKLIVQFDGLSVSQALDALAALNDWIWYPTEPGHILLTRRKLRLAAQPAYLPRLIQAAVPADMRDFLNIEQPSEDVRQVRRPRPKRGQGHFGLASQAAAVSVNHVMAGVKAEELAQRAVRYAKLPSETQEALKAMLVFQALDDLFEVMRDPPPYLLDPMNADLLLKQDGVFMEVQAMETVDGRTSLSSIGVGLTPPLRPDR